MRFIALSYMWYVKLERENLSFLVPHSQIADFEILQAARGGY